MPMQIYRRTASQVSGHVSANIWLWIIVFGAATVAFGLARWQVGGGEHLGDMMALAGALCGTLLMIKSQENYGSDANADDAQVGSSANT